MVDFIGLWIGFVIIQMILIDVKDLKKVWDLHLCYAKWLDFLNKIAEYTNLGANRTASLGVVKYTDLKHFS